MLKKIISNVNIRDEGVLGKITNISDRNSYDAYLVHQFLILGPLNLMGLAPNIGLNILIIIGLICMLAIILSKMSNILSRRIQRGLYNSITNNN